MAKVRTWMAEEDEPIDLISDDEEGMSRPPTNRRGSDEPRIPQATEVIELSDDDDAEEEDAGAVQAEAASSGSAPLAITSRPFRSAGSMRARAMAQLELTSMFQATSSRSMTRK